MGAKAKAPQVIKKKKSKPKTKPVSEAEIHAPIEDKQVEKPDDYKPEIPIVIKPILPDPVEAGHVKRKLMDQ